MGFTIVLHIGQQPGGLIAGRLDHPAVELRQDRYHTVMRSRLIAGLRHLLQNDAVALGVHGEEAQTAGTRVIMGDGKIFVGHVLGQVCCFIVAIGHPRLFNMDIDLLLRPRGGGHNWSVSAWCWRCLICGCKLWMYAWTAGGVSSQSMGPKGSAHRSESGCTWEEGGCITRIPADRVLLLGVLSVSSPENSREGWQTHTMRVPCERIRDKSARLPWLNPVELYGSAQDVLTSCGTSLSQQMPQGVLQVWVAEHVTRFQEARRFNTRTGQEEGIRHFSKSEAGGERWQWQ